MKLSIITSMFLSLCITLVGCSEPEESGRQVRAKYNALKEMAVPIIEKATSEATPVIERAKSDSQSFISGFMEEAKEKDD